MLMCAVSPLCEKYSEISGPLEHFMRLYFFKEISPGLFSHVGLTQREDGDAFDLLVYMKVNPELSAVIPHLRFFQVEGEVKGSGDIVPPKSSWGVGGHE